MDQNTKDTIYNVTDIIMNGKYSGNKVKRKKGKGNKYMISPAKPEQTTHIALNGGSPINNMASLPEVQHVDLQQGKDNQVLLKLETLSSEFADTKVTIQNIETSMNSKEAE